MRFFGWLRRWAGPRVTFPVRRPARRYRPMLEILEDRLAPATLTVTSLADDGSAGTLRYEISQAQKGDAINFQAGLTGTVTLSNGPLVISKELTITGPTALPIVISGNNQVQDLRLTNTTGGVTISDLTFTGGNAGSTSGGGIYQANNAKASLVLAGCTVSGNSTTGAGGGIAFGAGVVKLFNCTIANNQSGSAGGGGIILYNGGTLDITNSTLADNTTTGEGGGFLFKGNTTSIYLVNSIVAGNTGKYGDIVQASMGVGSEVSNDLVGNGDGWIDLSSDTGMILGTTANPIDPKLGPLQNNGGPTQTMALLAGSPAIDKGNNTYAVAQDGKTPLPYDQRGTGYPRILNNTVDMGAFEYTPIPPVVVAPTNPMLPAGTVGVAYPSTTFTASGGVGGTFTFSESGPLDGLTLSTGGVLSGTPTAAGTFNFTVTATDTSNDTGSQAYTLTINGPLSLSPNSGTLPAAVENNPYTAAFAGAGGSGTGYTYVESGTLPTGITFSNGQLTGTDTTAADIGKSFSFTVQVTDSQNNTVTNNYSLTVEAPVVITPATVPTGTVGNAFAATTFTATGGSGSGYTFSTSSALDGLTLSSAGLLSGNLTAAGSFAITITATDGNGGNGNQNYTLKVNPALTISPATLPVGTVGNALAATTFTASGGSGTNYTFSTSSALDGLTLSSAGLLSGNPTAAGSFALTITVTDGNNATGSRSYILTVDPALSLGSNPNPLPYAAQNGPYAAAFLASGGSGSGYTYSETGSLPAGIIFTNGQLSGAATVSSGTFNFTVAVKDSQGGTTSQSYTLTVEGPIALGPSTLPIGTAYNVYNQVTAFSASGGSGSGYVLSESGTLPFGVTFNGSTEKLTGTPFQSGSFPFTIAVTDSRGGTAILNYTLTVDPAVTLSPASLPPGIVGSAYGQTLTPGGGSGKGYALAETGTLPSGITCIAGTFAGTPTQSGSFAITVTVTDSNGGTISRNYTLLVEPALTLSPGTLPATAENDTYFVPLSASGGSGTGYRFTFASGSPPTGIGFSGNVLAGQTTSGPGTYNFTVTLTDGAGDTTTQNYAINVTGPVVVSPIALPAGTLGNVYTQTAPLTASGGSGTGYIFSASGPLPTGLTFNSATGIFGGTPTQSGTFHLQISATDSKGGTGSQAFALVINFSLGNSKNARFVNAVYEQLLLRAPDPGAASWVQLLDDGIAASTVVLEVERTTEYLSDVVNGMYLQYLGRPAAGDLGAVGWVNALARGASIESVTARIVASPEYFTKQGGSNAAFVNGLYQDILGRTADAAGLNAWMAFLSGGGSRYQTALSFLTSTEYDTDLAGLDYQQYLGRSGGPSELGYWAQRLQSGLSDQTVLAAIFGSPEGRDKWA